MFDGELRLGTIVELREDFYAYAYLHWIRRKVVVGDDEDTEDESKKEAKNEHDSDSDVDGQDVKTPAKPNIKIFEASEVNVADSMRNSEANPVTK